MDSKIKEIYILLLKKHGEVVRFTAYKAYYEFEIEWEDQKSRNLHCIHPEQEIWIQRKLFAMPKIRR